MVFRYSNRCAAIPVIHAWTFFLTSYSPTAHLHLQQMAMLGFCYHLIPRSDQRDDVSLGMIWTHVTWVGPDWDLWKTLYRLSYIAAASTLEHQKWSQRLSYLKAKTVHLEEHLEGEQDHEEEVGDLLEVVQPRRLPVVLSCLKTS